MRDFAIHALAMFAGSAIVLYVLSRTVLSAWDVLSGLTGMWRGNGSGPYRSDRSPQELYERSLRDAHRR